MATVAGVDSQYISDHRVRQWTPLTTTNADGSPVSYASNAHAGAVTVQVTGTFGVGGTVVIEGSNDGTNYVTLNDAGGAALSLTAAGLKAIRELPAYIRPRVTAGDGTTSLTVTLAAMKRASLV